MKKKVLLIGGIAAATVLVGGWALAQLWMFWLAPLIGGALGGVIYRWLSEEPGGVVAGK